MLLIDHFPERAARMSAELIAATKATGARCVRYEGISAEDLAQADVLAVGGPHQVDAAMIASAPRLRGIIAPGSGTDKIDVTAATKAGLIVAHGPVEENWTGMAEATVMLILAASYNFTGSLAQMRDGGTVDRYQLKGKTVGLLGMGRIAMAVADLLRPFGVRLIATPARASSRSAPKGVEIVSFEKLLADSDILSVHLALTRETRNRVDAAALAQMKDTAILVNTARGGLVDEAALIACLNADRLRCAALDVFEVEPLAATHPLRDAPRTILTPHSVGMTKEGGEALFRNLRENVTALLNGQVPTHVRNPEVIETWRTRHGAG